ncbi:DUF1906 domain-containing protein [Streptomyces flavidovirens]|uniref:DUF1906 domain-containing protein n=1 Tax=Streptomyces flavidovirens TaxID=67298 RepID=UPI00049042AA|nr:DUF1906 domain-containing protein [Streptomyces flavidovirens]
MYLKRLIGYGLALAATLGVLALPQQTQATEATAAQSRAPATRTEASAARTVTFRGRAFDTCKAPPVSTLRAWRSSPYRAVGVYFGGRGRACPKQRHLSRRWAADVTRLGWKVLPIFVGSQSPCVHAKNKRHVRIGRAPWRQGKREARQAVRAAKALGMLTGSALYLDMEAYNVRNSRCARTTLDFVRGWNREVRKYAYLPGFYSSAESGVQHMERSRRAGVTDLPSAMWFARWDGKPSLYGERVLAKWAWSPHRRIHQYAGNVTERHGGRRLTIDRNSADAPVARIAR